MNHNVTSLLMNVSLYEVYLPGPLTIQNDIGVYSRYEWTGLATIIANLLIILIIITKRSLRERLQLYVILAVGDIINGFYFFYANFNRLREIDLENFYKPTSKWDCTMKFYSFFQLSGTQFPALIALIISLERFLAVYKPIWYHANHKSKHRVIAVCFCAALVVVFLLLHYVTSYPLTEKSSNSSYCALTFTSDINYNRAHQAFITVTRMAGFVLSGFAFIEASRKSKAASAMRREALNVAPILLVSAFSVTLVTIPQVTLLLTDNFSAYPIFGQLRLSHWILLLTCVNSLTNIFIYIFFTRDFRRRVLEIVTFNKVKMSNNWAAVNATTALQRERSVHRGAKGNGGTVPEVRERHTGTNASAS